MSSSARGRRRPYVIERRDQLVALESAVRQEILDTLQAAGPRSAAGIAALMGRPADALYYHLRRLRAVGLLKATQRAGAGGRRETVYDLVGHPLVLRLPTDRRAAHPLPRLVRSMVATAERDFRAAVGTAGAVSSGPGRTLWAGRRHAWLTERDLHRVNRLVDDLVAIMTRARDPGRGQLCTLTLLLAPRAPHRRRARSAKAMT